MILRRWAGDDHPPSGGGGEERYGAIAFTGLSSRRYWISLAAPRASVCVADPGFDVDLAITDDTMTLHRVWVGHQEIGSALRAHSIEIDDPSGLQHAFPTWLQLSMLAHVAPAVMTA